MVSIDIADNMVSLNASDAVLNRHSLAGNLPIALLLFRRQGFTLWLFLRLMGRGVLRFISLKAGILEKRTFFWETIVLFIGNLFIMFLPFFGGRKPFDFPGLFFRNDDVLDRMPFFLSAIEALLSVFVLRTLNGTFGAVDDKF